MKRRQLVIRTEAESQRDHAKTWLWGFACGAISIIAIAILLRAIA